MVKENSHASDQDLLQLLGGELPALEAKRIRTHLAACWNCRARMAEMEATIGEFVRAYHQATDAVLPPAAGSRALLKARMANIAQNEPQNSSQSPRSSLNARFIASACAVAILALITTTLVMWQARKLGTKSLIASGVLPKPNLTPGATTANVISDICSVTHDEVVRPVPSTLQRIVLQEYGMRQTRTADYEIDFLISPGLGGAQDIRNLWPEPRFNTVWNSFVKDQLEEYLHESVCSGQLSLVTAQRDVASNWVSAYMKYFHTDQPLQGNPVPGTPRMGLHSQKFAALNHPPHYCEITLLYEPDRDNSL